MRNIGRRLMWIKPYGLRVAAVLAIITTPIWLLAIGGSIWGQHSAQQHKGWTERLGTIERRIGAPDAAKIADFAVDYTDLHGYEQTIVYRFREDRTLGTYVSVYLKPGQSPAHHVPNPPFGSAAAGAVGGALLGMIWISTGFGWSEVLRRSRQPVGFANWERRIPSRS